MWRKRLVLTTLLLGTLLDLRWFDASRAPNLPSPAPGPVAPSGAGAGRFYAAAANALQPDSISQERYSMLRSPIDWATPEQVQRNARALSLLRQGLAYPPQDEATFCPPGADLAPQQTLGRLLIADAEMKAERGDASGAMTDLLGVIRFGRDIARTGHGSKSVRSGLYIDLLGGLKAMKYIDRLSAPQARAVARRLEAIGPQEFRTAEALKSAERPGWRTYEQAFDPESRVQHELAAIPDVRFTSPEVAIFVNEERLAVVGSILRYGKQGLADEYTAYMDALIRRESLPYQRAKALPPISLPLSWFNSPYVPDAHDRNRIRSLIAKRTAYDRILLTNLALRAYRCEHSRQTPSTLSALTTGPTPYLKSVPTDPFSPNGDAPLRYDARTGIVYTVGENGIDDGPDDHYLLNLF